MSKIIIFNPNDYRIVFLLAAAIKAGYSASYFQEPSVWEAQKIAFLNIKPKGEKIHEDLETFIKLKNNKIKAWLYYPNYMSVHNSLEAKEILNHFSPAMQENARLLTDESSWDTNPLLKYHGQALKAALVISKNKGEMMEYHDAVLTSGESIAEGRGDIVLDIFVNHYKKIQATTQSVLKSIKKAQSLTIAKIKIDIFYLDNISQYLDLSQIREKILSDYKNYEDFLLIIQYRQKKQYNWMLTNSLKVGRILDLGDGDHWLKVDKTDRYEILIEFPHRGIINHLRQISQEFKE